MVEYMVKEHKISHRQAYKAVKLPQSSGRYKPKLKSDNILIRELQLLVEKHPCIGFWQCYYRIYRKGFNWNHKRVYRVYTALKLNIRRRYKRRPSSKSKAIFVST